MLSLLALPDFNEFAPQFSASIPGMAYALLGTSRQLNVAPEAALSLLLGQAIAEIRHDYPDPHDGQADLLGMGVATVITLQVGLISFLLGFFRLGFIDVVLSRALLRGFITAVAVVIMMCVFAQCSMFLPDNIMQRAIHSVVGTLPSCTHCGSSDNTGKAHVPSKVRPHTFQSSYNNDQFHGVVLPNWPKNDQE